MALLRILCFLAIASITVSGINALKKEESHRDIEIKQRLKLLNKPAIKTIKTDQGIFDCVDIYKQPAFDNPLLKDHKIQMKPTHLPDKSIKKGRTQSIKFGLSLNCPNGTVPIRRTTKEDVVRQQFFGHDHTFYHPNAPREPNFRFAVLEEIQNNGITGAKAYIGIFKPPCEPGGQSSGAFVWLTDPPNSPPGDSISAGWMVDPVLYGDSETHFTVSYLGKGGGCWNLNCPGFVHLDQDTPLGLVLTNISQKEGPLYSVFVNIFQDKVTKNWFVTNDESLKPIGYWPKELFSAMDDGTTSVSFGGIVKAGPNGVFPQMGSGYKEKCLYYTNAFIEGLLYESPATGYVRPLYVEINKTVDCPKLHAIHYSCKPVEDLGFYFMYGGPSGVC